MLGSSGEGEGFAGAPGCLCTCRSNDHLKICVELFRAGDIGYLGNATVRKSNPIGRNQEYRVYPERTLCTLRVSEISKSPSHPAERRHRTPHRHFLRSGWQP